MRLTLSVLFSIILLSSLARAWNVDDRCLRRRLDKPEKSLEDDERAYQAMVARSAKHDEFIAQSPLATSISKRLRGAASNAHRKLSVWHFRLKMYWEEGFCWQVSGVVLSSNLDITGAWLKS